MTKSRLSRKEADDLYAARKTVCDLREVADRGDANAKALVARARETISRLTAKRDGRIWL
jgi:hypothetical protein